MQTVKVAVLGPGTVGGGVCSMLEHAEGLALGPVLVREGKADAPYKVTDIREILRDDTVYAVAETLGGIHPAYEYVSACLQAGKHVVTANKALVAEKGIELAETARQHGAAFLFTAACGGGVPFLHNLALARQSDTVLTVGGILNGTTNYMLDAMQKRGADYNDALKDAQTLGYAEADPTADVSGLDALRKIMLACAVAFDALPTEGFDREGITALTADDVKDLKSRGLVCRLLAKGGKGESGIYAFVEPTLVSASSPEASVPDNYNLARYEGSCAGDIVLIGQGAGRFPTASAVVRDLSCVLQGQREMLPKNCQAVAADNTLCGHPYYFRLPEAAAASLPVDSMTVSCGIARVITKPMTVRQAHETAAALRLCKTDLFFAGIEE